MIVFSRPPGWRRRAGDPGSAGGFAEASVGTSSSGAYAPEAAKSDPSGGLAGPYAHLARPCDGPPITADHAPGPRARKAVRCVTLP